VCRCSCGSSERGRGRGGIGQGVFGSQLDTAQSCIRLLTRRLNSPAFHSGLGYVEIGFDAYGRADDERGELFSSLVIAGKNTG
jgi:hypothetical protein